MDFEWDWKKEEQNIKKHKVSFLDSVETFSDPNGLQFEDKSHSKNEIRYYWIGKTKDGRILTTYFTFREGNIRIIGAAEWRKFRRVYEATQIK